MMAVVSAKVVDGRLKVHVDLQKGDLPGHPFRGNQWTGGGGAGERGEGDSSVRMGGYEFRAGDEVNVRSDAFSRKPVVSYATLDGDGNPAIEVHFKTGSPYVLKVDSERAARLGIKPKNTESGTVKVEDKDDQTRKEAEEIGVAEGGIVRLYHGTAKKNVDAILLEGFKTVRPASEGGRYESMRGLEKQPKAVYLTPSKEDAKRFGANASIGFEGGISKWLEMAVFEVDITPKELKKDRLSEGALYTERSIPPSSIRSVTFYQMQGGKWVEKENRKVVDGKLKSAQNLLYVSALFTDL